jgi:Uma2 family endonuclease
MIVQLEKRYYTPEEYLALENEAEGRNEYIDGEIFNMTGGTTNHNKIAGNFYRAFPLNINGLDYEIYINDVKLWISQYRVYTYPDIMVIKGEPIYQTDKQIVVTNPCLIVEVLSESTENYDRTNKFKFYRSLPSLEEYILISQSSYYIEQFSKQNNQWLFNSFEGKKANLELKNIACNLSLAEIYNRVVFNSDIAP